VDSVEERNARHVRKLEAERNLSPEVATALKDYADAGRDVAAYQTAPFVSKYDCGHEWRDSRPRPARCPECEKLDAELSEYVDAREVRIILTPGEVYLQEHPQVLEEWAKYQERQEANGQLIAGSAEEARVLAQIDDARRARMERDYGKREHLDGRAVRTGAGTFIDMRQRWRRRRQSVFYDNLRPA